MDMYFLTDKGRAEDRKPLPRYGPEDLKGYIFDRGMIRGFVWGGGTATSLEDILNEVVGETEYELPDGRTGPLVVTEQDVRTSLRRLFEAGLVDKVEQ